MSGIRGRSGGQNRRPDAHKALAGTLKRGREQLVPAACEIGAPERPAWLEGDAVAVEAWTRLCALMLERKTVTPSDQSAITLAAKAESEFRACDAVLLRDGLTVLAGEKLTAHPLLKARESAWRRWSAGIAALGLQPLGRERVPQAPPSEPANEFARFMNRSNTDEL